MRPLSTNLQRGRDEPASELDESKPLRVKLKLRDIAFFFQFVRPVWKIGAASILLVMITTAISSLLPLTSKIFIDFVVMKTGYDGITSVLNSLGLGGYTPAVIRDLGSIEIILAAMIIAGLVYGVLNILQEYLSARYLQEVTFNLQRSLFDHVLRFPMAFIKNKQVGYLMSRVSDDVNMMQFLFSDAVTQIISSMLYLTFVVLILFSLNARLAIFIVIVIPVYFVVRFLFSDRVRELSYRERESNSEIAKNMQEALSGIEVVKSYATEKKEVGKVLVHMRNARTARITRAVLMSLARTFMSGTMFVLLLVVMYLGAQDLQAKTMTIGDYVTFISYILFLSTQLNMLYRTYMTFQPAFTSMYRLREMFSIVPEFEWDLKTPLKKLDKVTGHIRFDDVSFSYNKDEPVLRNISFELKQGESVALVGHSGVGKTTLASLVLKLYIPQSGGIYLDGHNLNDLDHSWLRQQISVVSQDIFLFNDTIENNIKYGKAEASLEEVIRVAKKAYIHDFIASLPQGYDTIIGERGTKLSVGQRQRISIARAFLKDTPILILDEPTSAIDPETELHLKDSLDELMKGRTTIIISHRMSLTEIATRVIALDGGRIAQSGTYMEMADKKGLYGRLRASDRTLSG